MRHQHFELQKANGGDESLIQDIVNNSAPAKPNDLPHQLFKRLGYDFVLPPTVRLHPCLRYRLGTEECFGEYPAMVMPLRTGAGRYCGIEVLFMDEASLIAPVIRPIHVYWLNQEVGAHMQLHPPANGLLGVAVNMAEAMAAHHWSGVPMSAVRTAEDLRELQIPEDVRQLVVFTDHRYMDEAQAVVQRARQQGIHAEAVLPATDGATWLDEFAYRDAIPIDSISAATAPNQPRAE